MPAAHEDPTAPVTYRASGVFPYSTPSNPQLPTSVVPRQVTLRDRVTTASLIPFATAAAVPLGLLRYLSDQLNKEIEKGDTYPMIDPIPLENFGPYWFANFGAVMMLGEVKNIHDVHRLESLNADWRSLCLGSFNIKPNYPGRSSHICNGMFLVTDASRNRGVGRLMGEIYIEWAPLLGYTYSVFNLVYETNVASCRIWDALGFKRIGKIPACGSLRSHPAHLVDAIIYGRDLGPEGDDYVSEERFDKIRYYLKHQKYPSGADRAEKSRLRSAATHYKLIPGTNGEPDKLMLKDKEVISDPHMQYEIARSIHFQQHAGINKTTATIALKYHWVRIKETVSMVIKHCPQCKESPKAPASADGSGQRKERAAVQHQVPPPPPPPPAIPPPVPERPPYIPTSSFDTDQLMTNAPYDKENPFVNPNQQLIHGLMDPLHYADLPLDPQIMEDIPQPLQSFAQHSAVDPYGHNGLPDPRDLQHNFGHPVMNLHDQSSDYKVMDGDDDAITSQTAAELREQAMRLVEAGQLNGDAQLSHDLLSASFVARDEQSHFES